MMQLLQVQRSESKEERKKGRQRVYAKEKSEKVRRK